MSDNLQAGLQRAKLDFDPFSELCRKVLLLIADDAVALSHYRPLIALLNEIAHSVVVVTRSSARSGELEALGVRAIDFDYGAPSSNPMRGAASAWALGRILEAESPDAVHLVGLDAIVLGGLALKLVPAGHVVIQVSGLGALVSDAPPSSLSALYRAGALRLMASMLRRPSSRLLVDTADDLTRLRTQGVDPGARFAVLGGVGVDAQALPALPVPGNDVPLAAFFGRLSRSDGIDVLMQAYEQLAERRVPLRLELCGAEVDEGGAMNTEAVTAWCAQHQAQWTRQVVDVQEIWRRADICVLPARHGGTLSRTLLEAAACARPLLVTNLPGCRQFVRNGIEGVIVPPEEADALAQALERLARDAELRRRMGEAARLRLLHGFTEAHVKQALKAAYASMLGKTVAS